MRWHGRVIDAVALWEQYVQFPPNVDLNDQYLPLVKCPNPQHQTEKRHFQINQVDGLVHCFARCGISGSFSHAIQIIEGCNEREARRTILRYARKGIKSKVVKRRFTGTNTIVDSPSLEYSTFIPQAGIEYLTARGINSESVAKWEIGWDTDKLRIVIPAKDEHGITRFLIERAVKPKDWPKYLYTEGAVKSSLLFGACALDPRLIESEGVVLVEGSLDAIRLCQHGITNVVATLGTGLGRTQCEILSRLRPRRILLYFDRDTAGVRGQELSAQKLRGKYPLYVVRFPRGKFDPAECSRKEVERAIERAIPLRSFKRRIASPVHSLR